MAKKEPLLPDGYGVCPDPTDPELDQVGPRREVLAEDEAQRIAL